MTTPQSLTQKAIVKLEKDAVAYEVMGAGYDSTDADRAQACRDFAQVIRGWKTNNEIISNRVRMNVL